MATTRRLLRRGLNPPLDPEVERDLLRRAGIPDIETDNEIGDSAPRLGAKSILPARSDLVEALGWGAEWLGDPASSSPREDDRFGALRDLLLLIYGPALGTRLGLALLGCLERGWLRPDKRWSIVVDDPLSATPLLLPALLEVLSSVGTIFRERVAPDECRLEIEGGGAFLLHAREVGRYEISKTAPGSKSQSIRVVLRPEWDPGPEPLPHPTLPQILITRGATTGAQLDESSDQRQAKRRPVVIPPVASSARVERALTRLLTFVFAKKKFRPGQLEAIRQVSSGIDCSVCLPGPGDRNLVYHLASLLRPGCTLVVGTTQALIENQISALRRSGIDRLARLAQLPEAPPPADALFVFVRAKDLRRAVMREQLSRLARLPNPNPLTLAVIDEAQSLSESSPAFNPAYTGLPDLLRSAHASSHPAVPILALLPPTHRSVVRDVVGRLSPPGRPGALVDRPGAPAEKLRIVRASPSKALARLGDLLEKLPKRFGLPAARFYSAAQPGSPRGIIICSRLDGPFGILAVRELIRSLQLCRDIGLYSERCPAGLEAQSFAERCRDDLAAFERGDLPLMIGTSEMAAGTEFAAARYAIFFGLPPTLDALVRQTESVCRRSSRTERHLIHVTKSERRLAKLLGADSSAERVRSGIAALDGVLGEPDDLLRALAAHVTSFPNPKAGLEQLMLVFEALESRQSKGLATLEPGDSSEVAEATERSLARLVTLGAIGDWTIEEDGTVAVTLSDSRFSSAHRRVLDLALRTAPSSVVELADRMARYNAMEPRERTAALIEEASALVELHTEPARRASIEAIWSLVSKAGEVQIPQSPAPVRGTVGPRLEALAGERNVTAAEWLELFNDLLVQEGPDIELAAATLEERYPESSGVRFAAALGTLYTRGDRGTFAAALTTALSTASHEAQGDWSAARDLFDWLMPRVQTYLPGWSATAWNAWREAGGPHHLLGNTEIVSLAGASQSVEELSIVLTRRLRESCDILESLKEHYSMDAAEL